MMYRPAHHQHAAFTLLELIIVISIAAMLMGLVFWGTRDIIHTVKVQRSAHNIAQAFDDAKGAAAATGLAHSIHFNNTDFSKVDIGWANSAWGGYGTTLAPRFDGDQRGGLLIDLPSDTTGFSNAKITARNLPWLPSPLWSTKPDDQWFYVTGPWKEYTGKWRMARGGMPVKSFRFPTVSKAYVNMTISSEGKPCHLGSGGNSSAIPWSEAYRRYTGGLYGYPLDANGKLPFDQWDDYLPMPETAAHKRIFDPYGVGLGPKRYFERGSRLMIAQDNPEWSQESYPGISPSRTLGLHAVACPELFGGWGINVGNWEIRKLRNTDGWNPLFNFNVYASGWIGSNACNPSDLYPDTSAAEGDQSFRLLAGSNAEGNAGIDLRGVIGVVSMKTRSAFNSYTTWSNARANPVTPSMNETGAPGTSAINPPSVSPKIWTSRTTNYDPDDDEFYPRFYYPRPIAQLFVSVWTTGEVIVAPQPILGR